MDCCCFMSKKKKKKKTVRMTSVCVRKIPMDNLRGPIWYTIRHYLQKYVHFPNFIMFHVRDWYYFNSIFSCCLTLYSIGIYTPLTYCRKIYLTPNFFSVHLKFL